jgi:hypothetical protein
MSVECPEDRGGMVGHICYYCGNGAILPPICCWCGRQFHCSECDRAYRS